MAKFSVLNPRGIPKGTRILAYGPPGKQATHEWFEGDDFEKPARMNQADVDRWIDQGFLEILEEVEGDG